jgi:hypothetical protein
MAKYLILYQSSASARELMASATPEEMQASMKEWMVWKDSLPKALTFEWGMPLQPVHEITNENVGSSNSTASGYAIMEGEKDEITEVLKSHPHLKREGATIELLEMLSMPGM